MIEARIANANGIHFNIEAPSFPLGARIVWMPPDAENDAALQEYIIAIANRDRDALDRARITSVAGRSFVIENPVKPAMRRGMPLCLEISGFGRQMFKDEPGIAGIKHTFEEDPIRVPSCEDFDVVQPGVSALCMVEGGELTTVYPGKSICGAYTLEQAAEKLSFTTEALRVAGDSKDKILVPEPRLLGRYEGIPGPDGIKAYFMVFDVPYSGRRTGIPIGEVEIENWFSNSFGGLEAAAHAVRFVHDTMGVTHNSMLGSNWFYPGERQKFYIADWASVQPIDINGQFEAIQRANDLKEILFGFWNITRAFRPDIIGTEEEVLLMNESIGRIINGYLGVKPNLLPKLNNKESGPNLLSSMKTSGGSILFFKELLQRMDLPNRGDRHIRGVKPFDHQRAAALKQEIMQIAA
jgi:hypothetical protein